MASPEEVVVLALSAGESVSRIARLREAGGSPMAIERASLPPDILPNPTLVTTSLYEVLEESGNRPVRALQKISAMNLEEEDAPDLLDQVGHVLVQGLADPTEDRGGFEAGIRPGKLPNFV